MSEAASAVTRRSAYGAGARAIVPILFGVVPFGIIFGALAVASGLPVWMTAGMSAIVFAGSAQFVAIGLIAGGTGVIVIVLTTFLVNVRHNLYAASLAPHLGTLPKRWLVPLAYILTDEAFVVVIRQFDHRKVSENKKWFYLGSALTMYIVWQTSTWIGIWAGASISDPAGWGLDFALPATFIVMLLPMVRTRGITVSVLIAGALSLLLHGLPYQLGLIVAMIAGAVAGAAIDRSSKIVYRSDESRQIGNDDGYDH